jgi:hypothetical protein
MKIRQNNIINKLKAKLVYKHFWVYCCLGIGLCFFILLIVWFTGISGYSIDEPKTLKEFIFALIHYPHIIFGLPILLGIIIGYFLCKENDRPNNNKDY